MKREYQIVSDGSCDLPAELAKEKKLSVVPFYVSFDEEHYYREMTEIGVRDFYDQMVQNPKVYPKSSMPTPQDFYDAFLPAVQEDKAVLCICITTKFSGSMQSALNARAMILEDYENAEITVMDATINTVLQGIFVLEALHMQEDGVSYEDNIKRLEEIKSTGRILFSVGDMEYLKHGGRIGKLAGLAGSLLDIKPLITLKEGEIFPSGVVRGRKKSRVKVIEMILDYLKEQGGEIDKWSICIGFGYDRKEAEEFREQALTVLRENHYEIADLPLYQIGATIAVHTGPYPLGFGIVRKYEQ